MAPDAAAADEIAPETLADRIEAGEDVAVLDTRNRDEIDAWHVEGPGVEITHVPYVKFLSENATGDPASLVEDDGYVVVCPEGEASAEVAAMLAAAGVDAVNLAGGMEGWARVYRHGRIAADATDATVHQYRRPASGCLAYLVESAGETLVVDPLRAFADRYAADARESGATVEYVLDTHVHADHFSGLRGLAESTGATALVSAGAAERGMDGGVETVADGDGIEVGDVAVEVLATPGHTTGAVSLRVDDLLLSGDSLFLDGAPRPDLQKGDDAAPELARTLHATLTERLADLPDRTVVAPGHVPPGRAGEGGTHTARLGDLRERLSAFSTDREAFVERVVASMDDPPANFETIAAVNLGRESVDEATAFEMELGPNNCAVSAD
ncbi:MBL fold metallo-hydrolase [Natronomonas marina]|jgi:glyoxylase-like metal-dependent hydrolase (beta-lactamase superfamily II)|uniref:MBL fold metallo-hydrolase n=1 Tax=Natronomonas marina TaxID=2961939 RepID=UPI0020C9A972|nr:MBL fold metallo-hydrolase [Natronomonas marina]